MKTDEKKCRYCLWFDGMNPVTKRCKTYHTFYEIDGLPYDDVPDDCRGYQDIRGSLTYSCREAGIAMENLKRDIMAELERVGFMRWADWLENKLRKIGGLKCLKR